MSTFSKEERFNLFSHLDMRKFSKDLMSFIFDNLSYLFLTFLQKFTNLDTLVWVTCPSTKVNIICEQNRPQSREACQLQNARRCKEFTLLNYLFKYVAHHSKAVIKVILGPLWPLTHVTGRTFQSALFQFQNWSVLEYGWDDFFFLELLYNKLLHSALLTVM